jgi:hypothetical protein
MLAALAAGLGLLATPRPARADDAQAFELAKNPFDAGQYADAHARLAALLDASLPPCEAGPSGRCRLTSAELIERARALDAASLLALKRDAEADALIAAILRQNPDYAPSPAMFPQEVIDRFTSVRAGLAAELRAIVQQRAKDEAQKRLNAQKAREAEEKWIHDLQELAGTERRVDTNSRWLALVPFGIGQFQNGDMRLGITFAASEMLFGGASLVTTAIINSLAKTDVYAHTAAGQPVDVAALNTEIINASIVNRVAFIGWAAISIAGVIQAQVAFVPERVSYPRRSVPPRPKIAPIAAPLPGGGGVFGVGGTF